MSEIVARHTDTTIKVLEFVAGQTDTKVKVFKIVPMPSDTKVKVCEIVAGLAGQTNTESRCSESWQGTPTRYIF